MTEAESGEPSRHASVEPAPTAPASTPTPTPGPGEATASGEASAATPESPIAAALAGLDRLPELDLAAHADVYQHIHGELQRALAAIDDA